METAEYEFDNQLQMYMIEFLKCLHSHYSVCYSLVLQVSCDKTDSVEISPHLT